MSVPSICVLGSCNMDLVAYVGRYPRLGETVTGDRFTTVPGGKGANQAIAAARAGGAVTMIGAVGRDAFGPEVRATLADAGVRLDLLREVDGPTGTAHITVDAGGGNAIVVVPSANGTMLALTPEDDRAIAAADVLVMQLELPLEVVAAGAAAARRAGTRVALTPAPVRPLPDTLMADVDLLLANEHEAAQLGLAADGAEPGDALAALLRRVPEAVVTLGGDGALYGGRDTPPVRTPAAQVAAVDTTAAGDCFAGALVVAMAEGRPVRDALRWATAASGLSVQRRGASSSMPGRAEIEAFAATLR
jgi:ribokinase